MAAKPRATRAATIAVGAAPTSAIAVTPVFASAASTVALLATTIRVKRVSPLKTTDVESAMKKKPRIREGNARSPQPKLAVRFSPYAWAKLIYLRDRGGTEVGGFGIATGNDLLAVTDIELVRQQCSIVSVEFNDESVADYLDRKVDNGLTPAQCMRIWVHTHPGDSAQPSCVDEETFERVFRSCDWALMFILAREGEVYARLRFNVGPGGELIIPVVIDYGMPFEGSDYDSWEAEYELNVNASVERGQFTMSQHNNGGDRELTDVEAHWMEQWAEYANQHEGEFIYGSDFA